MDSSESFLYSCVLYPFFSVCNIARALPSPKLAVYHLLYTFYPLPLRLPLTPLLLRHKLNCGCRARLGKRHLVRRERFERGCKRSEDAKERKPAASSSSSSSRYKAIERVRDLLFHMPKPSYLLDSNSIFAHPSATSFQNPPPN